jgi:hypothetical protein
MMRFRAILNDPGNAHAERPVQNYGYSRASSDYCIGIDEWAAKVLEQAVSEQATVEIYETTERLVEVIKKNP